jgi:hypothetical protein
VQNKAVQSFSLDYSHSISVKLIATSVGEFKDYCNRGNCAAAVTPLGLVVIILAQDRNEGF